MITKGVIRFEDGLKASEEYAPAKKVAVELHFDIDPTLSADGVQATFDVIAEQCKAKVYELLGTKQPAAGKGKGAKTTGATIDTAAKDALKVAHADAEAGKASKGKPVPAADPASMDDFTVQPEKGGDVIEDDLTVVEADPVSDAELNSAVQKRNAEIKNPGAIRTLIGSYNPDPAKTFTLAQIPQGARRGFLDKLKGLQAAT